MVDAAELLLGAGLVTREQLAQAASSSSAHTLCGRLAEVGLDGELLAKELAALCGVPPLPDPLPTNLAPAQIPGINPSSLRDAVVAPLGTRNGVLYIAVADPADAARLAHLDLPQHRVFLGFEPRVLRILDGMDLEAEAIPDDDEVAQAASLATDEGGRGRLDAEAQDVAQAARPAAATSAGSLRAAELLTRAQATTLHKDAAPPASRSRGLLVAGVAVAIVALIGGVGFALTRGEGRAGGDPAKPAEAHVDDPLTSRQKRSLADGMKKLDAKDFAGAKDAFTATIDIDPSSAVAAQALVGRARARVHDLDVGGAKTDLRRAIESTPIDSPTRAEAELEMKKLP